jgi:hypothetical protein
MTGVEDRWQQRWPTGGAGRILRDAAKAEDDADEDGEGAEEPKRGDGASAGQCDGGQ